MIRKAAFVTLPLLSVVLASLACGLALPSANTVSTLTGGLATLAAQSTLANGLSTLGVQPTTAPGLTPLGPGLFETETAAAGSGGTPSAITTEPQATKPAKPVAICDAIPLPVMETALGRPLVGAPEPFQDATLGDGCQYSAGKDSSGNAYFAYVTKATEQQYQLNKTGGSAVTPVQGLGNEAFTTNGADAEQLWVLVRGKGAVMVAIGDAPKPAQARALIPYLLNTLP
jgi:hypothetical protein